MTAEPRTISVEDIVTLNEIAERFGVHRGTVRRWDRHREETGFPAPIKTAAPRTLDLYDYAESYAWFQEWRSREHTKGFYT